MSITEIIAYLNETNSANDKLRKLKEMKGHDLFKRVLEMTYDKVRFTYGVTFKNVIVSRAIKTAPFMSLETALDELEKLTSRQVTGNDAIELLGNLHDALSADDAKVLELIIGRDLKMGCGRTSINKAFKNLIVKPAYMRCGLFGKKAATKLNVSATNPALVQLKADGTYREMLVSDGIVEFKSRSGEPYEYPLIVEEAKNMKKGYYFGELTVEGITDRSEGNGLINSDDVPHERLIFSVWDYVTEEEYQLSKLKDKTMKPFTKYGHRWIELKDILEEHETKHIQPIESHLVATLEEAIEHASVWMSQGLEGAVLKSQNSTFKDGTNNDQLKIKLQIDADVRVVGFKDGTKGTKREGKVGSIQFVTDDGKVQGYASGFSDEILDEISKNKHMYMNRVFSVQFNDITKGRNNEYYALSHPRFIEWRDDKTETDDLERIFENKEMAKDINYIFKQRA